MEEEYKSLAVDFIQHFYQCYDGQKGDELFNSYLDNAWLSFDGSKYVGKEKVVEKYTELNFNSVEHTVECFDAQTVENDGLLVKVNGTIDVNENKGGGSQTRKFTEVFLLKGKDGNWGIEADVFKFV